MSAFIRRSFPRFLVTTCAAVVAFGAAAEPDRVPGIAHVWTIAHENGSVCRIILGARRADAGDRFLGMPAACRHAMPGLRTIGRWAQPDATHLSLDDPAGRPVLTFVAAPGGTFSATAAEGGYRLTPVADSSDALATQAGSDAIDAPRVTLVASRRAKPEQEPTETAGDLAGRYAVMREKRDTGCMVTLDDKSRGEGGSRAQLAPGCRDQGIVIFDPTGWRLVKGALVLTARAGHKAVLEKRGEGLWEKEAKDGAKPLGLKKL